MGRFRTTHLAELATLPDDLRARSLDYVLWSSRLPLASPAALEREARRVDQAFCRACVVLDPTDAEACDNVLRFARANRACIARICDRSDRRDRAPRMRAWFAAARRSLRFCGGARLTWLNLVARPRSDECPVCLEDAPDDVIIFDCGHTVCAPCAERLHGRAIVLGGVAPPTPCPMCRAVSLRSSVPRWRLVSRGPRPAPWDCWRFLCGGLCPPHPPVVRF